MYRFLRRYPILLALILTGCTQAALAHSQQGEVRFPPLPKVKQPLVFLAPHGGRFNFVTCTKGPLVFSMAETYVAPGMGPLPHVHHYTNEWFYAPEGGYTVFASAAVYDSVKKPPSIENGTQTTVYLMPLQAKQIMYGPKFYTHGFINHEKVDKPLTIIWKPDPIAPSFPSHDGGIREYFTAVSQPITDPNNLPIITEENRKLLITEAPKYGINQSFYFLQYVNRVDTNPPKSYRHPENMKDLNEILAAVEEYNSGSKKVTCK